MAIVAYSTMYPDVLPEVPGCPVSLVEDAIRNAAIEFCERAKVLQYEHAAIDAVEDQRSYPFVPPSNTVVASIIEAWYDGNPICPKTPQELADMYQNWLTEEGTPNWYTQVQERSVELVPKPSASLVGALVLRVFLKPSDTSTQIEDRVQQEYHNIIGAGAKASLMAMREKTWTNLELAAVYASQFEDGVGKSLMKSTKGFGRARLRTRPRFF